MPPFIALDGVWFAYPDSGWALQDITLQVDAGDYVAIVGANGAGKTTLAKQCNGLLLPTRGEVRLDGQPTSRLKPPHLARAVGYVFQNPDHQIFASSIREEVAFGPRNLGLDEQEVTARTDEALMRLGLVDVADRPPALLGLPVRRQVALAAVYAMRPRALILDEPTGGLDFGSVGSMMRLIGELHAEGHTIILISHDMELVGAHAKRVLLMQEGRILLDDTPQRVFGDRQRLDDAGLSPPQITTLSERLEGSGVPRDVLAVPEFVSAYIRARSSVTPRAARGVEGRTASGVPAR